MNSPDTDCDPNLNSPKNAAAAGPRGWRAGDIELDLELRRVTRDGEIVTLQAIPFGILARLLEHGGRPLTRRELQAAFWPHHDAESFDRSLNTAVRKLRRAIGDDARAPRLVETLRATGYRWIGPPPGPIDGETVAVPASAPRRWRVPAVAWAAVLALTVAAAAAVLAWPRHHAARPLVTLPSTPAGRAVKARLTGELAQLRAAPGLRLATAGDGRDAVLRSGAGVVHVPLTGNPAAAEELLAQLFLAHPPASADAPAPLPPTLQQERMEASSVLSDPSSDVAAIRRAVEQLQDVTAAAPGNSGAWLALAHGRQWLTMHGEPMPAPRIRRALRRAVAADPQSTRALLAMARYLFWQVWDKPAAMRWMALARQTDPHGVAVLHTLAWMELARGRTPDALAHIRAAAAADPLDPELQSDWGWFYFRTGDFRAAAAQCRHAAGLPHPSASARACEFQSLYHLRRFTDAWRVLRDTHSPWLDGAVRARLDRLPPQQACRKALRLAAVWWRRQPMGRFMAATEEAAAGDMDAASADALAAVRAHEPAARLLRVTPGLTALHVPTATQASR